MAIRLYRQNINPPQQSGWFTEDQDQRNYSLADQPYFAYIDASAYYSANPSAGPVSYQEIREDTGEIVVSITVTASSPVSPVHSWNFVSNKYYRLLITGLQSYVAECDELNPCPDGYDCVNGVCVESPGCSDNSDCGPCEKCEGGECVPCECSDGMAQLIMYLWHPVEGDTVRVRDVNLNLLHQVVDFGNFSTHYLYSYRLACPTRFESGMLTLTEKYAEPITGILGDPVQRQLDLMKGQKYVDKEVSDYLYRTDVVTIFPVLFGFTGEIVLDLATSPYGQCNEENTPEPPEPLKPPITEPPPTEPPEEPEGGDEPIEIDEPLPPDPETPWPPSPPPSEPQGVCECEIYQAKMIVSGLQEVRNAITYHQNKLDARLADGDRVIFGRLTSLERVLYHQLSETNRLLYQISNWFGNVFFSEVRSIKESVQSMSDDLSDIRNSLRLAPCEPDYPDGKTIAQIADDFEKHYYPAVVEVLENDVVVDSGSDEPDIFCRKLRS